MEFVFKDKYMEGQIAVYFIWSQKDCVELCFEQSGYLMNWIKGKGMHIFDENAHDILLNYVRQLRHDNHRKGRVCSIFTFEDSS